MSACEKKTGGECVCCVKTKLHSISMLGERNFPRLMPTSANKNNKNQLAVSWLTKSPHLRVLKSNDLQGWYIASHLENDNVFF